MQLSDYSKTKYEGSETGGFLRCHVDELIVMYI